MICLNPRPLVVECNSINWHIGMTKMTTVMKRKTTFTIDSHWLHTRADWISLTTSWPELSISSFNSFWHGECCWWSGMPFITIWITSTEDWSTTLTVLMKLDSVSKLDQKMYSVAKRTHGPRSYCKVLMLLILRNSIKYSISQLVLHFTISVRRLLMTSDFEMVLNNSINPGSQDSLLINSLKKS